MYKDIFLQLGLNQNESTVYEYLLEKGESRAGKIIENTPLKRGVVYGALDDLLKKELIGKKNIDKVAYFSPSHPERLKEFVDMKEKQIQKARITLDANISSLISSFNLVSNQPGVKYLEGIDGFQKTYEDILKTGQDVLLFRSLIDNRDKKVDAIIQRHLKLQSENSIHTRAITPLLPGTAESVRTKDTKRLVERRIVPKEKFSLPAQILIYSDKVAITSYDKDLVTTIIENDAISVSFRIIFEFMWELSTPLHDKIHRQITSEKISTPPSKTFS